MTLHRILDWGSYFSELIAFFISLQLLIRYKRSEFAVLFILMLIVIVNESLGVVNTYTQITFLLKNYFKIANICLIIELISYQILISLLVREALAKKMIFFSAITNAFAFIILSNTIEPVQAKIPLISYSISVLCIISAILYYFYEKIKRNEIQDFTSVFWNWALAFLMFFIAVEIPFMTSLNYALEHHGFFTEFEYLINIKLSASIIYYCSFIAGLIWMKKT